MSETPDSPPPLPASGAPKTGMPTGAKVAIGCGIALVVVLFLCGVSSFVGYRWVQSKVTQFEADFAELGLEKVQSGQQIIVTEPPTKPSYYMGQMVTLDLSEPVAVPIGVIGQVIELKGEFAENVYCRGQVVNLSPSTVLRKDLDVTCQVVQMNGATLEGELTGSYQAKQ